MASTPRPRDEVVASAPGGEAGPFRARGEIGVPAPLGEAGQASVEWVALVLVAALALGGLAAFAPRVDGRSFGGFLAHRVVCAARSGCDDGEVELVRAYGARDAELLRRHAPNIVYEPGERQLPVDPGRCRARRCADAVDDRDADVHRSGSGERAVAFTRVVHRGPRTYLEYWLYYPDSNSTFLSSDRLWQALTLGRAPYPGFHRDDWEGYVVRVERDGRASARATSHGHWQGCKLPSCEGRWTRATGWTRVSRGSHAGHLPLAPALEPSARRGRVSRPGPGVVGLRPRYPGLDMRERTSTGEALRLLPLETLPKDSYRPLDRDVAPPWRKRAYRDPESESS